MSNTSRLFGAAALGYLLGTLPSADLVTRRATGREIDVRRLGSGNPGTVNVSKVFGTRYGVAVAAADLAKGAASCRIGRALAGDTGAHVAGTAAVVGHGFPVWTGFRGGKGVACGVAQCAMTFPAFFPVDLGISALTLLVPLRRRAFGTTAVAATAWVAGGVVWWRSGRSNLWGPRPTAALPGAAAASSAVILYKFVSARSPR